MRVDGSDANMLLLSALLLYECKTVLKYPYYEDARLLGIPFFNCCSLEKQRNFDLHNSATMKGRNISVYPCTFKPLKTFYIRKQNS